MSEFARGEYEVNADGSFTWCAMHCGEVHTQSAATMRSNGYENWENNLRALGYKRRDTIGPFGSGATLTTKGGYITGRNEPEPKPEAEPQRAPLPYFSERTDFDPFGPEFIVSPTSSKKSNLIRFNCVDCVGCSKCAPAPKGSTLHAHPGMGAALLRG